MKRSDRQPVERLRLLDHVGEPDAAPAHVVDRPARDAVEVGDLLGPWERAQVSERQGDRPLDMTCDLQPVLRRSDARHPAADGVDPPAARGDECLDAVRHDLAEEPERVAGEEEPGDAGSDDAEERGPPDRAVVHGNGVADEFFPVRYACRYTVVVARPYTGLVRVYLCRHAEAAPGDPDDLRELTATGREQARALAARLAAMPEPPVLVVTSPLLRARQTAKEIAAATGAPLQVDARLEPGATRTCCAPRSRAPRALSRRSVTSPTAPRSPSP